jgi:hypothetical protein
MTQSRLGLVRQPILCDFVDNFLHPPRAKICDGNDTTYNNPKLFAGRRVYQMLLSGRSTLPYAADKREKSNPDCGGDEEGNKLGQDFWYRRPTQKEMANETTRQAAASIQTPNSIMSIHEIPSVAGFITDTTGRALSFC